MIEQDTMTTQSIVCVLGMHRSGTSLVSHMLHEMGVYLGRADELMPANQHNEGGYWEHHQIAALNDVILRRLNGAWDHPPRPVEGWELQPDLADLRQQARELIQQTFAGHAEWGWKDPRTSLTLPFWRTIVEPTHYVLCLRTPAAVVKSLQQRDSLCLDQAIELWVSYTAAALRHTTGRRRLILFYEDLMVQPRPQIRRLAAFLSRHELTEDEGGLAHIEHVVRNELRHHHVSALDAIDNLQLPFAVRSLFAALCLASQSPPEERRELEYGDRILETLSAHTLKAWREQVALTDERSALQSANAHLEAQLALEQAVSRETLAAKDLQIAALHSLQQQEHIARYAARAIVRKALRQKAVDEQLWRSQSLKLENNLHDAVARAADLEQRLAYAASLRPARVARRYVAYARATLSGPVRKVVRRMKAGAKRVLRWNREPASGGTTHQDVPYVQLVMSRQAPWSGPLISIVLPCRSLGPETRRDVRDAIARQTFTNLELVVWDAEQGLAWLYDEPSQPWLVPTAVDLATSLGGKYVCVADETLLTTPPVYLEMNAIALESESLAFTLNLPQGTGPSDLEQGRQLYGVAAACPSLVVMRAEVLGPELRLDLGRLEVPQAGIQVLGRLIYLTGAAIPAVAAEPRPVQVSAPNWDLTVHDGTVVGRRTGAKGWGMVTQELFPIDEVLPAPVDPGERPRLLVVMPFLAVGGAEKITLDVIDRLRPFYDSVVVTLELADPALGSTVAEFRQVTPYVYTLPAILRPQLTFAAICYLIERFHVGTLFVANGSGWIYDALPHLRGKYPHIKMVNQVYDHQIGWIERYDSTLVRAFDRHIAPNQRIVAAYQMRGVPSERIDLIYHGVDLAVFDATHYSEQRIMALRAAMGLPLDRPVVVFMARMHPQKRPLDFIAAAQRFRPDEAAFLMVGDGMLSAQVDRQIAQYGLSHIRRMAFYKPAADVLAVADVMVICSEYEGLPVVLLEAQAMGRRVVGTDVGAIKEALEYTGGGVVIDTIGDVAAIERAIRVALGQSPQPEAIRARVAERFAIELIVEQYYTALS